MSENTDGFFRAVMSGISLQAQSASCLPPRLDLIMTYMLWCCSCTMSVPAVCVCALLIGWGRRCSRAFLLDAERCRDKGKEQKFQMYVYFVFYIISFILFVSILIAFEMTKTKT